MQEIERLAAKEGRRQVMHVEPRVSPVRGARRERERGGRAERPQRATREQTERRRARGHARHVTDERVDDGLGARAVGLREPHVDGLVERRRSDEQRLANDGIGDLLAQVGHEHAPILGERRAEIAVARERTGSEQPLSRAHDVIERQERRAKDEESRRGEPFHLGDLTRGSRTIGTNEEKRPLGPLLLENSSASAPSETRRRCEDVS